MSVYVRISKREKNNSIVIKRATGILEARSYLLRFINEEPLSRATVIDNNKPNTVDSEAFRWKRRYTLPRPFDVFFLSFESCINSLIDSIVVI